jgi:hypothetical protein
MPSFAQFDLIWVTQYQITRKDYPEITERPAAVMRLFHAGTLELQDFTLATIPPYAILSHTWMAAEDDVTFQDMASPRRLTKRGFDKIVNTRRLALEQGPRFVWIDTCCIDKSSSAELSQAIKRCSSGMTIPLSVMYI